MRTYLDTIRKPADLPLLQDEEVLKYYTASYDIGSSLASSWRLGNLYLTNKRLLFVQGRKVLFKVPLSQIKDINIVKRKWLLGKKVKQLNIVSEGRRVPYIAIKDPEYWKKVIEEGVSMVRGQKPEDRSQTSVLCPMSSVNSQPDEKVLLKVDVETLDKIVTKLDTGSKEILWFLYENRHARIDTLAKLIKAPTHMDVLLKIRDIINPTAEKIIGYPILSFESAKVDHSTGENVTFSWWLSCRREEREPLLDVFDEDNNIVVYIELLGFDENRIQLEAKKEKLVITGPQNYCKEILLPTVVSPNVLTKKYKNNILEVRLKKAEPSGL